MSHVLASSTNPLLRPSHKGYHGYSQGSSGGSGSNHNPFVVNPLGHPSFHPVRLGSKPAVRHSSSFALNPGSFTYLHAKPLPPKSSAAAIYHKPFFFFPGLDCHLESPVLVMIFLLHVTLFISSSDLRLVLFVSHWHMSFHFIFCHSLFLFP